MKSNKLYIRFVIFILVLVMSVSVLFWWWNESISAVDVLNLSPQIFVISKGESVKTIASNLTHAGLIRSPTAFFIYVKLAGLEKNLQAGDFRLNKSMDVKTITTELTHGIIDVWITVLEGWRNEEIAIKLARDLDIPESEFLKIADEGYMFPDTYLIPKDATAGGIVKIFRDNFNQKFDQLHQEITPQIQLNKEQIIILASIVEREGKNDVDRPVIAGILLKRLKEEWPLQVDATLQYLSGYQPNEKTWWKKNITDGDKAIKSQYNTYLYKGLPPKPISNPGLSAIKAVLKPTESSYWYYLHDNMGNIHYADSIEEHTNNISRYLLQ